MSFIKNFIYNILSLQETFLKYRLSNTLSLKRQSKTKRFYQNGIRIDIESMAESERQKMEEELSLILKSYEYKPSEILKYISTHGTEVKYLNSEINLRPIGENEGFILPQKGFKAFYLSLLIDKKIKFKTEEMFLLSKKNINIYYFIYHFYNWYAYKHNICGLDSKSQLLLKKYLFNSSEKEMKKLQLNDIYKLADAIKQDKSAINFVIKLCKEYESSKAALEKIKNDGANI